MLDASVIICAAALCSAPLTVTQIEQCEALQKSVDHPVGFRADACVAGRILRAIIQIFRKNSLK